MLSKAEILVTLQRRNALRETALLPLLDIEEECGKALYDQAYAVYLGEEAVHAAALARIRRAVQREYRKNHPNSLTSWGGNMILEIRSRPYREAFLKRRGVERPSRAACMSEGRLDGVRPGTENQHVRLRPPIVSLLPFRRVYACVGDGRGKATWVWRSPKQATFAAALAAGTHDDTGLRALATERALLLWQSTSLHHAALEQCLRCEGVRLRLHRGLVLVHQETCAFPEHVPWVFSTQADMDVEERRSVIVRWLHGLAPLAAIYPDGFDVRWYM